MKRAVVLLVGSIAALFAFAREARAQDTDTVLGSRHHTYASPQNFAAEIRFAPYRPAIDSDPALHGKPYESTFGTMKRLEFALELDWQAVRIPYLGTLGPGVSFGYTSMSDTALKIDRSAKSGDETSLDIFPMYAVAVLRADVLMQKAHIPLVPYGKLGLGYALWRAYTTGGTVDVDGTPGKGMTWGYHAAAGVAFQLDVLDNHAAKNFDESTGVNHTYFFGEWMYSALNGIGQKNALRVGTSTWVLGLAFEF